MTLINTLACCHVTLKTYIYIYIYTCHDDVIDREYPYFGNEFAVNIEFLDAVGILKLTTYF